MKYKTDLFIFLIIFSVTGIIFAFLGEKIYTSMFLFLMWIIIILRNILPREYLEKDDKE